MNRNISGDECDLPEATMQGYDSQTVSYNAFPSKSLDSSPSMSSSQSEIPTSSSSSSSSPHAIIPDSLIFSLSLLNIVDSQPDVSNYIWEVIHTSDESKTELKATMKFKSNDQRDSKQTCKCRIIYILCICMLNFLLFLGSSERN